VSRIGKQPVQLPSGVKASLSDRTLTIEKGAAKLTRWIDPAISVTIEANSIAFTRSSDVKRARALHGTYRSLANAMVVGLTTGFEKRMQVIGVGFGAKVIGKFVELNVGYAQPRKIAIPAGITVECPKPEEIIVKGADKEAVGQLAAKIRLQRPPEPYKGKGVRYVNEVVQRKQGKAAGT
jgi:large subunit ribosomal protein L6